ncbi:DNA ligase [Cladochytrium replicatum]|nr:DNA ligase [Cladochytrium replicatum]
MKRKNLNTASNVKTPPKKAKVDPRQTTLHSFFNTNSGSNPSPFGGGESPSQFVDRPSTSRHASPSPLAVNEEDFQSSASGSKALLSEAGNPEQVPSGSTNAVTTPTTISIPRASSLPSNSVESLKDDPAKFDPAARLMYWENGGRLPFRVLAEAFALVSTTSGRNATFDILSNLFRAIITQSPERVKDLVVAMYLTSNSFYPPHESVEIGIGPQVLSKAVIDISDLTTKSLRSNFDSYGDFGDVFFAAKSRVKTLFPVRPLKAHEVFDNVRAMAKLKGPGSVPKKTDIVRKMLTSCEGEEARYLPRILVQNIRIGAVRTTSLVALARAYVHQFHEVGLTVTKKELQNAEQVLKTAYAQSPSFELITPLLLDGGLESLARNSGCRPGIPIKPMLGKITRSVAEVFEKFPGQEFCVDLKFDGQRAQIHFSDRSELDVVKVFSRHLMDMTNKYPEVVEMVSSSEGPRRTSTGTAMEFIVDGEIVAVDAEGNVQPFQVLSTRKRDAGGNAFAHEDQPGVCVKVFDLMYLDGQSLLQRPLRERLELLHTRLSEVPGKFTFVPQIRTTQEVDVTDFLTQGINQRGVEGLMLKLLDNPPPKSTSSKGDNSTTRGQVVATYEPDKRSDSWIKIKKDYVEGLSESFDLVVIGAYNGTGRKVGWWSPFLLATYDPQEERYSSLCKVMTGFTDEFYKSQKAFYSPENGTVLEEMPAYYDVHPQLTPDAWFTPVQVWEIKGADITVSPIHRAAMGLCHETRGLSLRFPRFIKVREDKNPEDANTPKDIAHIFREQRGQGGREDDYDLIDEVDFEEEAEAED